MNKVLAFAKKNPVYVAVIHAIGGIGIGILIASPVASVHPVRWGVAFIIISLLGHLYMLIA
jgi:hypothetical protein